jgi:hypothetical protein
MFGKRRERDCATCAIAVRSASDITRTSLPVVTHRVNQASGASVWTAITQRQPKARKATDRGRVARSPRVGACVAPLRAGGGRYAACRSGAFVRAYRIPQFRQLLGVVDADRARGGLPPGGGLWNFPHRSFRPTRVDVLVRSSAPGKVTPRSLAWIGRRSTPGSRTVRAEPPRPDEGRPRDEPRRNTHCRSTTGAG